MNSIGSKWRKFDLHFHTPTSDCYENKLINNQEIIDVLHNNEVEVVAITDHHTINVENIKALQKLGQDKVLILPGIEFRAELSGKEPIHFIGIFSDQADIEDVWKKLEVNCRLTDNDIKSKGGECNINCDLKETTNLIHELGGIVSVHAGSKTNTIENVTNKLSDKMAMKTDLVTNYVDILELGKEIDQDGYINKVFPIIKRRLPMIICSDNHDITKYALKQNLWIKSEPTFEGLKQILFEPTYRVHIGENPPINPPITINNVTLDFPENTVFGDDTFCFSGKHEIKFSPNFTCVIGGRGTGKSTILNLIHKKLRPSENQFFKEMEIKDHTNKPITIDQCISIDNDVDEKYIEFLSQNEVENFAKDYQKLTKSIYSRILHRDEKGLIIKYEGELSNHINEFKNYIDDKREIIHLNSELQQKKRELSSNQKIVVSFSSEKYIKINKKLKSTTGKLEAINSSQEIYEKIINDLNKLIETYTQEDLNNFYAQEIDSIVLSIKKIVKDSKSTNFADVKELIKTLGNQCTSQNNKLKQYLSEKGLTEENRKDISSANLMTSQIEADIKDKREKIESIQKRIDSFDINKIKHASNKYKDELKNQIYRISEVLENLDSPSVKPISLYYEFDTEVASESVFSDFKIEFKKEIDNNKHKGDDILKKILFSIPPNELIDKDSLVEKIDSHDSTSMAKLFLHELLANDSNFELYKLLADLKFIDFANYMKIKVQYDNKPIEKSSFGQRCTAVLVILLLLGNNPIIIDEPEAHLDSLLISNYLVEVIKKQKLNRQIIFATHNANFVINGDSELVHVLNIDESKGVTKLTNTTIENFETRDVLIELEGGREAFKKREKRYQ